MPWMFIGGVVSIASKWSGTSPKPLPWKGTQRLDERKKHVPGTEVPGAFSMCHRLPGLGDEVVHFEEPASMSSTKRTLLPAAVIFTSSRLNPVYPPAESEAETLRSEAKRNISVTGWTTVVN